MRKATYKLGQNDEETFTGYTDDSLPGLNVAMTKEEAVKVLDASPYDYRFTKDTLTIYHDKGIKKEQSTPIPTDSGDILKGWFIDLDLEEIE